MAEEKKPITAKNESNTEEKEEIKEKSEEQIPNHESQITKSEKGAVESKNKNSKSVKKKKKRKKIKDSVRKRKLDKKAAIQRFLPIAEIRNDTMLLKAGGLRAVLEVEALNFNLKSETEQEGIIVGYQSFINSLPFPVQIVISSRKVNITPYLKEIRKMASAQKNELLKNQTESYADFVEKIVEVAMIMKKRFYLVVPLDDASPNQTKPNAINQFFSWMQIDDSKTKAIQRYRSFITKHTKLVDRINLVKSGLNNIGLLANRLSTKELIELYYKTYNPRISANQRINKKPNTNSLVL